MQILLASAKLMRDGCRSAGIVPSVPRFQGIADMFAADMGRKTADELSVLFGCSLGIGLTSRDRFSVFGTDEVEVMPR